MSILRTGQRLWVIKFINQADRSAFKMLWSSLQFILTFPFIFLFLDILNAVQIHIAHLMIIDFLLLFLIWRHMNVLVIASQIDLNNFSANISFWNIMWFVLFVPRLLDQLGLHEAKASSYHILLHPFIWLFVYMTSAQVL